MTAQDFKLDDDGDLVFSGGDLKIDLSDKQHIKDIINSNTGWWKQFPLVGVGIDYYLNSSGKDQQLEREIKIQLIADGYSVERPIVTRTVDSFTIQPNADRL